VEVVLSQLVMMFEGFGTTFVYVVVRRFAFDFGVSLFSVFLFIDFGDSPLFGGVSCRFFRFCL